MLFNRSRLKGQSLVEFIIIMPLFFAILFGIFEFSYIYRAKSTLNTATFESARQGSLENARLSSMRNSLVNGMLAEYVKGDKSLTGIATAIVKTKAIELEMNQFLPTIEIVSPTKEVFDHFKVNRMIQLSGQNDEVLQDIIPNDNLNLRSTNTRDIEVDGATQKINIQDANLLKIKSYWCYEMKVPIIKNLIFNIASLLPSKEQLACNGLTGTNNLFSNVRYLALSSQSVVRMQSPIVVDGSNLK